MTLQEYRQKIDKIDDELARLFAERVDVTEQIAAYKRANGLTPLDTAREAEKLAAVAACLPAGLRSDVTALFAQLLSLSRSRQERLAGGEENVILIGMPGCGKKTIGRALARAMGRPFVSSDKLVRDMTGKSIPAIFRDGGEAGFRALETEALALVTRRRGLVLATGGGCVTRAENRALLRGNGKAVWVKRDIDALPTAGRPLSQTRDLREMYAERAPLYADLADVAVDNDGGVGDAVRRILEAI